MSHRITLYTFPVSHFAEKVRWLLDYAGIPFAVVNWVPVVHALAAYLKSGKRTVPFIEVSAGTERIVVHDSTAIVEWVNEHYEHVDLMPDDDELLRQAMAFEDRADAVGDDVIRYMYAPMIERRPEDFIEIWAWDAKPIHRRLLRVGLPVVHRLLDSHLDFSAQSRVAGLGRLHDLFVYLDQGLSEGRRFLVGDRLSIADISVASLLAPVCTPGLHPVYSSKPFRTTLLDQRAEFEGYASFAWMRQLYAEYRRSKALLPARRRDTVTVRL